MSKVVIPKEVDMFLRPYVEQVDKLGLQKEGGINQTNPVYSSYNYYMPGTETELATIELERNWDKNGNFVSRDKWDVDLTINTRVVLVAKTTATKDKTSVSYKISVSHLKSFNNKDFHRGIEWLKTMILKYKQIQNKAKMLEFEGDFQ
jgi:hypothetical protein